MADTKKKSSKVKAKKPISYFYNPFYQNSTNELQFLEVWQVLEDDVLGSMYPWQYVAAAETSNRIVTLNFQALKNFENDYRKFYDQSFVYKVSAKLLSEGNVHRLGSIMQPNLILCFDIYQLEKFGDKAAIQGLKFLTNIGATIMIEGVDKAPVDVLLKYPTHYFLLDYRYYTKDNKGVIQMLKQLTEERNITLAVANVRNKNNLEIFLDCGVDIFSGAAFQKPKRRAESFIDKADEAGLEETKKSFVVQAEGGSTIEDKPEKVEEEVVTIEVTSAKDEFKARLAASILAKQKAKEEEEARKAAEEERLRKEEERRIIEEKRQAAEEAARIAEQLGSSQIATSTSEFEGLSKNKKKKKVEQTSQVIKLTVKKKD